MNIHIDKLIDQFTQKHILVIGDVMLDEYIWGNVNRISPEAPVPVVKLDNVDYHSSGAANVGENLFSYGCEVTMVGLIGNDTNGDTLKNILNKENRFKLHLVEQPKRPTTVKTRIMAQGQQVMRVDNETEETPPSDILEKLKSIIGVAMEDVDGVILQDYGKGLF